MMYGFGDDVAPLPETLDLVEGIVLDYASTLLHKVGQPSKRQLACATHSGCLLLVTEPVCRLPASLVSWSAPHPACLMRPLPPALPCTLQAMDSAAQRGKLRKPGAPGAGTAVGAEDILFLVRKVGRCPSFCRLQLRLLRPRPAAAAPHSAACSCCPLLWGLVGTGRCRRPWIPRMPAAWA